MDTIALAAMDLDGTLLRSDQTVSDYTAGVLCRCEAAGIPVVLASGRGFESVRVYAERIGLRSPLICVNGARVEASPDGETLLERCIPEEASRRVCEILLASGLYFLCYARGVNYHGNPGERLRGQMPGAAPSRFTVRQEMGLQALREEGVHRPYKYVTWSEDPAVLARLRETIAAEELPVFLSSSWRDNLEIMADSADKGEALRFLAERLGIPRGQVMAFGDERNDLSMLRYAGWPVAMGNACDEVRAVGRVIAPSNDEDGVASVLERYALKGGEPI